MMLRSIPYIIQQHCCPGNRAFPFSGIIIMIHRGQTELVANCWINRAGIISYPVPFEAGFDHVSVVYFNSCIICRRCICSDTSVTGQICNTAPVCFIDIRRIQCSYSDTRLAGCHFSPRIRIKIQLKNIILV